MELRNVLLLGQRGHRIYLLSRNSHEYNWLNIDENNNISINLFIPVYIPDVQIEYISANYKECYAIGKDGNLYEKKEKILQC